MKPKTIKNIHGILSGAFAAAVRWGWLDSNPTDTARLPKASPRHPSAPTPAEVAHVIVAACEHDLDLVGLYVWLAAVTGARRGELCGLQWPDIGFETRTVLIASSYLARAGQKLRKDTKTHQDRTVSLDPVTCDLLAVQKERIWAQLRSIGLRAEPKGYVFTNDPAGAEPWNPDWATHKVAEFAAESGIKLNINGLRHYTASELLAAGFDIRNTAARLGQSSGGATTLRYYADPIPDVDRRAAAYLADLTAPDALDTLKSRFGA